MGEQLFTLLLQSIIVSNCTTIFFIFFSVFHNQKFWKNQPSSPPAWFAPGEIMEHRRIIFWRCFLPWVKKGSFQPSNLWWIDVSSLQLPEQVLPDTCKTVRGNFLGAASSDATEIQVRRTLIFAIWTAICWCIQRIPSVWMFLDRPKWCQWSWLITLCLTPYYILLYHIISPWNPTVVYLSEIWKIGWKSTEKRRLQIDWQIDWQILGQGFHILPTCMEDLPPANATGARRIPGPNQGPAGRDPCLDGAGSHHLKERLHIEVDSGIKFINVVYISSIYTVLIHNSLIIIITIFFYVFLIGINVTWSVVQWCLQWPFWSAAIQVKLPH